MAKRTGTFYDAFKHTNVDIDMFNITGGNTPIDPVSLNPLMFDNTTKAYYKNESFMDLLRYSQPIREAQPEKYDAIYFTGGHGVMYDFPENKYIQSAVNTIYENGESLQRFVMALQRYSMSKMLAVRI